MRIKLIHLPCDNLNPNTGKRESGLAIPPLGIATLSSYLRKNNIAVDQDDLDIKVMAENDSGKNSIDMSVFGDETHAERFIRDGTQDELESTGKRLLALTRTGGYDAIGLSVMRGDITSPSIVAMVLGKLLKERHGSLIIIGGTMHTSWAEKILQTGHVDYRLLSGSDCGLGEVNLLNFCKATEQGKDVRELRGVQFIDHGKLRENRGHYSQEEILSLVLPDFDGLPMELYRRTETVRLGGEEHLFKELVLPFSFVRGCPFKCAFCMNSQWERWARKEPDKVVEELQHLSRRHRTHHFMFLNPLINPTYEYAERIADEIISRDLDLRWTDCAVLAQLDRALLRKLKQAGAVRFIFGLESGSQRILERIRKPISLPKAEELLKETYEAGIWPEINLICGFPYECEDDVEATLSFLKRNEPHIMSVIFQRFRIDGQFYHSPETYGIRWRRDYPKPENNWMAFTFDEIGGLQWDERLSQTNLTYQRLKKTVDASFIPNTGLGICELFVYADYPSRWQMLKKERRA